MLIQFSFKNYKSFRDDTVLDLSAAKMTEFNAQLIFTTHDTWQLSNQLRLYIPWQTLLMRTAQESVRTKAMKRTICLENMGQFLRLRRST